MMLFAGSRPCQTAFDLAIDTVGRGSAVPRPQYDLRSWGHAAACGASCSGNKWQSMCEDCAGQGLGAPGPGRRWRRARNRRGLDCATPATQFFVHVFVCASRSLPVGACVWCVRCTDEGVAGVHGGRAPNARTFGWLHRTALRWPHFRWRVVLQARPGQVDCLPRIVWRGGACVAPVSRTSLRCSGGVRWHPLRMTGASHGGGPWACSFSPEAGVVTERGMQSCMTAHRRVRGAVRCLRTASPHVDEFSPL